MPRTARKKFPGAILHVMVRSISEVSLFRDNRDREKYLALIKKYKDLYMFNVYGYCLMTTHAHMIIDCCGSDISKIMKSINQSYVQYYNKRYGRHGHLFQDRFKSKIVDNDNYLIALSAYIHNNPKDIKLYKNDVSKYPYSSLAIYLGVKKDHHNILNTSFILQHFSCDIIKSRKTYVEIMKKAYNNMNSIELAKEVEFVSEKSEYRSARGFILRETLPEDIKEFMSSYLGCDVNLHLKYSHKNNELKSLFIVIARSFSNLSLTDICLMLGNITLSNAWRLSQRGSLLIQTVPQYKNIIQDFIRQKISVNP
ncbi:transposase [Clostridium thermarum]|uniref:transposase n=1 Tax=Clostridium thermarum TaxID=1716543 RepID=UPI0013D13623|nr:transposase [Clostridium thermarum]